MKVVVYDDTGSVVQELALSDTAKEAVVLGFNPSGDKDVLTAKSLAAAAITFAELISQVKGSGPLAGRRCSLAKTDFETGAMFLVKAITGPQNK